MFPTYNDISYFIEVADTRNISRAAERLGISQPSLSSAMMRLEASLGADLLIRNKTGVQLTKSGLELKTKGRLLLLNWEQLKADINKQECAVSGEYVLGCHPSVALYSLSKFLPALVQKHPELNIKLVHDLSRKITERVVSFEVDFGIVVNPIRHPDLVIKKLCVDEVSFWTASKPSSTQILKSKSGILICDLDLIQVQKLIDDLQKQKLGFRRIIHSSSLEVITDLTASGIGVGLLPKRVATRIEANGLKPLDDLLPVFEDQINLVYRADSQKTKGSQIIIDAIKTSVC